MTVSSLQFIVAVECNIYSPFGSDFKIPKITCKKIKELLMVFGT